MSMDQPSISLSKRITWHHPEWWLFGLSLIAWLAMAIRFDSAGVGFTLTHQHHHGAATGVNPWIIETFRWMMMVAAMMLPLVADSAREVAARSLWSRRQRAIAGFVLGYLSI